MNDIDELRFNYDLTKEERLEEEGRLYDLMDELKPSIDIIESELTRLAKEVKEKKLI